MLLKRPFEPLNNFAGTLARVPLAGGAPREMSDDIVDADWSPDGQALAIVRKVGGEQRIEFPTGKVLYETSGWIEALRFSPKGNRLAFMVRGADVSVEIVDLAGAHRVLSHGWKRATQRGLAWSANGSEIWFTVNESGWRTPLRAVTPGGRERLVLRLPNWFRLQDVSRDGRVLVSLLAIRTTMRGLASDQNERDLSWHEASLAKAITPDGRTLLFDEGNEGYFHTIYVRPMDGSPAKRIGEGRALAISPDGRWVASNSVGRGSPLVLLPTGAGEPKVLEGDRHRFEEAAFFPDGERLLLLATDAGRPVRSFVMDLSTSKLRAVAPERYSCRVISPDGREIVCVGPKREAAIFPVEGGMPRSVPGFRAGEEMPLTWSSDGRSLFVGPTFQSSSHTSSLKVFRLDLATGKREFWHEFVPPDRAGLTSFYNFTMTPDGRSYAYSYLYAPADLYLISGLK
jgi:Tol biopolymer transport system component